MAGMSDFEQDHDNASHSDPESEGHNAEFVGEDTGNGEHADEHTGHNDPAIAGGIQPAGDDPGDPEPPDEFDGEATKEDLDASGVDPTLGPELAASEGVIHIADHQISVEMENPSTPEAVTSVQDLNAEDLQRVTRIMQEEAARRGAVNPRPFRDLDDESLLVLYNQVRAEVGSR